MNRDEQTDLGSAIFALPMLPLFREHRFVRLILTDPAFISINGVSNPCSFNTFSYVWPLRFGFAFFFFYRFRLQKLLQVLRDTLNFSGNLFWNRPFGSDLIDLALQLRDARLELTLIVLQFPHRRLSLD